MSYERSSDEMRAHVGPRTSYLLFLDESGTHDMQNVDPAFPVFVLAGLLVGEAYYVKTLVPRLKALKQQHLGDKNVVLHSKKIRRGEGAFERFRQDAVARRAFHAAIGDLFSGSRVRLFAVVIDKPGLRDRFVVPVNPYDISLSQLLSVVCGPPRVPGPNRPHITRITAESRGKREDKELQREYNRLRTAGLISYGSEQVQNRRSATVQRLFPPRVDFIRKDMAVAGLELADLAAYPIARAAMSGDWTSQSAQVIARKLRGLIFFP